MNLSTPVVKVEGLSVKQGNYLAVRDVSFELSSGINAAVVGPNGAGKSTLVQAILGLIPHHTGKIEIFGRPLSRLGHLRSQVGYIPQHFVFDRSFPISVNELVGLGWVETSTDLWGVQNFTSLWRQSREKSTAIAAALRRTDTYNLRHQAIGSLSGGQIKRVLLAYCLVMARKLLVLDEAFAGIDLPGMTDFHTLLNEIKQEEGWTVLQVSHDIDMVSRYCDRVICLNQTVIYIGSPEIALSPQNLLATYGPSFRRY